MWLDLPRSGEDQLRTICAAAAAEQKRQTPRSHKLRPSVSPMIRRFRLDAKMSRLPEHAPKAACRISPRAATSAEAARAPNAHLPVGSFIRRAISRARGCPHRSAADRSVPKFRRRRPPRRLYGAGGRQSRSHQGSYGGPIGSRQRHGLRLPIP